MLQRLYHMFILLFVCMCGANALFSQSQSASAMSTLPKEWAAWKPYQAPDTAQEYTFTVLYDSVESLTDLPTALFARFHSIDPMWEKYRSWTPYNYSANSPLNIKDADGKDWFYYQGEGEDGKSWHHHDGETATYTDVDGNEQTTSKGYKALVRYTITTNQDGVAVGNLKVFDKDNKLVANSTGVVSGGALNADGSQQAPADERTFMIRTGGGNFFITDNHQINNGMLQTVYGLQFFGRDNSFTATDGSQYSSGPWGVGRIRLNHTDQETLGIISSGDRGLFLHSDFDNRGYTNGCVCEPINNTAAFNYFYNNGTPLNIGKVPFVVEKR